jgi:NAD(P)-dependent dehydrogenase (short-subunit alcohol dehydrogenase family)
VVLSSAGHRFSDVDLDDPNFERGDYDPWVAYGRSKTANALFALELDRRLGGRAHAYSVHPGRIVTELGRHLTEEAIASLMESMSVGVDVGWKSVPQGAATTCWAATAPELVGHGGAYLEDCGVAVRTDDPVSGTGVRAYAADPERAAALWARTEEWLAS